ncbi:MAG: hypothetical protein KGO05_10195 [Chloroflexota bacterium]|nr:hypothetical protein [Chloroflexota bacterium]
MATEHQFQPSATTETRIHRRRAIGLVGVAARIVLGGVFIGSVLWREWPTGLVLASWALALLGFPAALLLWLWIRARFNPSRFQATGPWGFILNLAIFLALYLTPLYAPALAFTSDAALLFYGASMLLAAARGYAGCEVLAVSNWLLRRDDQVGCVIFAPIDSVERRWSSRSRA